MKEGLTVAELLEMRRQAESRISAFVKEQVNAIYNETGVQIFSTAINVRMAINEVSRPVCVGLVDTAIRFQMEGDPTGGGKG